MVFCWFLWRKGQTEVGSEKEDGSNLTGTSSFQMHNAVVVFVILAFAVIVVVVVVVSLIFWPDQNYFHPICVVRSSAFRRHLLLGSRQQEVVAVEILMS